MTRNHFANRPHPQPRLSDLGPLPWMAEATCAGHFDPDMWFRADPTSLSEAAAICADCPVRDLCDQYATDDQLQGTWGGRWHRGVNADNDRCGKGHPWDDVNTYLSPSGGPRQCRECRRLAHRDRAARLNAAAPAGKNAWAEIVSAS